MKYFLFSVKDTATQLFAQPFPSAAEMAAIRSVRDLVGKADNAVGQHPEDYELHQIGMFDDNTGVIDALSPPRLVARCKDLLSTP